MDKKTTRRGNYESGSDYVLEYGELRFAFNEDDFGQRVERLLAAYRETLPEDRRSLLDAYHLVDTAIKVVGVGSVGRRCWIALLMSASNEPLFLQGKEAVASVLEPSAKWAMMG